jgi:uncharacterized protein YndB with AHSA1/START domain
MAAYSVTARSRAPREQVFALLADATTWPRWAGPFIFRGWFERQGDPPPGGVGAIRRLGLGPASSREEIVEYAAPATLAYTILSGLPVREYRATVRLTAEAGGTRIDWTGEFRPLVPGTARLLRGFLTGMIGRFARGLAAAAEEA